MTDMSGSKHWYDEILRVTRSYSAPATLRVLFLTNGRPRLTSGQPRSHQPCRTPRLTRRGLVYPLMNEMRRVSAASVDSQFPVDPRYAGPRAG